MIHNCLFLEVSLNGHVLEWVNHLYIYASETTDRSFHFVLPNSFHEKKVLLKWREAPNISLYYLSKEEEEKCNQGNPLKCAWACTKVLRKYVKLTQANVVFQAFLMRTQPFLSFALPSGVVVIGVIYRIFLYNQEITPARKIVEKMRYYILSRSKSVRCAFILNDKFATDRLNTIYKTNTFAYLPDPLNNIIDTHNDLRAQLGIDETKKIFFQFGSLDERKSTMAILNAIKMMKTEELADKCFVFSGRVASTIKNEFESLVKELSSYVQIIVLDGFIPYEQLNDLCYTCDYIFVLYKNHSQSSGTLGYAAYFKKNVIGTSHGLIGKLIREYELGTTVDVLDSFHIKDAIMNAPIGYKDNNYVESHRVTSFCKTIFEYF